MGDLVGDGAGGECGAVLSLGAGSHFDNMPFGLVEPSPLLGGEAGLVYGGDVLIERACVHSS